MNDVTAQIKLLILDVDGVLTDGLLHYGEAGEVMKTFHTRDGLGIRLLIEHGIDVALITGRNSRIVTTRAQELGITYAYQGRLNKLQALQELLTELQLNPKQVAYMGDDLIDLPILTRVGLAAAPVDAHPYILQKVHFVAKAQGGQGAVRELADFILTAQDKLAAIIAKANTGGELLKNEAKTSC